MQKTSVYHRLRAMYSAKMSHKVICGCSAIFAYLFVSLFFRMYPTTLASVENFADGVNHNDCACRHENVVYDFCYRLPTNLSIKGRRFDCKYIALLQNLKLLSNQSTVDFQNHYMPAPRFVTAMSENHYKEGLTLIANIRKFWKTEWITVYDLGLDNKSAANVQSKCFVDLRKFPFELYPDYVAKLKEYRWKPILIAMTLKEFGAVWYMDASVRWFKDDRDVFYKEVTCSRSGLLERSNKTSSSKHCAKSSYLIVGPTIHSTYATTHFGLYNYLPTNTEELKKNYCYAATFAFAVRTADTVELMKWDVLCALEKDCMAPPGAQLKCSFKKDKHRKYANCHRYDQSVINILLANLYDHNPEGYVVKTSAIKFHRWAAKNISEDNFKCD
ncbi:unnamed protein product [Cylicocyclus nassatus]|uniref:Uncharacterized protein n=1 Tax=Cylicocyclus nassatus TaxID=53992 RepID=A0AA36MCQ1_CYLNA|nr:unnamed protein product [Cylicocyclus nassatus]